MVPHLNITHKRSVKFQMEIKISQDGNAKEDLD